MIFDNEKFYTKKLNEILDNNYERMEGERFKQFLLKSPKYGNDDKLVDTMANLLLINFL